MFARNDAQACWEGTKLRWTFRGSPRSRCVKFYLRTKSTGPPLMPPLLTLKQIEDWISEVVLVAHDEAVVHLLYRMFRLRVMLLVTTVVVFVPLQGPPEYWLPMGHSEPLKRCRSKWGRLCRGKRRDSLEGRGFESHCWESTLFLKNLH